MHSKLAQLQLRMLRWVAAENDFVIFQYRTCAGQRCLKPQNNRIWCPDAWHNCKPFLKCIEWLHFMCEVDKLILVWNFSGCCRTKFIIYWIIIWQVISELKRRGIFGQQCIFIMTLTMLSAAVLRVSQSMAALLELDIPSALFWVLYIVNVYGDGTIYVQCWK